MQASLVLAGRGQVEISHAAPGKKVPFQYNRGDVNVEVQFATMTARFFSCTNIMSVFYSNPPPLLPEFWILLWSSKLSEVPINLERAVRNLSF